MILLIDNYDSFSYNLYQLIGSINPDIKVIRNNELSVKEIEALNPSHIIISPGPGRPEDAGICEEVIKYFKGKKPIFGVCLGHQAICEAFGGTVTYAKKLMHGKKSLINVDSDCPIFKGLPKTIEAARYHSLSALKDNMPDELKITAMSDDGEIMAVQHKRYPIFGVQFHPESIMTPDGSKILRNFFNISGMEDTKMIKEAISKAVNGKNLTYDEAKEVMNEIMSGNAAPSQIAAFLTAMHIKGETVEEITACAEVMRKFALRVNHEADVLEIVGTGGDKANTFNISTLSAIVVSAAGTPVAKHGNRAASSKCGTADCLEALGVKLNIDPEKNSEILKSTGMCFMFAQKYHTAMKYVGPVRKEIGIPTIFNILGPLTNPAYNTLQLLGVYKEELLEPLAKVLYNLGVKRAMAVYGQDCLDEISMSAPTSVCEIVDGKLTKYEITPEQYGLRRCSKEDLSGGTPEENAAIALEILNGTKGPKRDAVLINSGAALHIAKQIPIEEGIKMAAEIIDSGKALEQLNKFIKATNA